MTWTPEMDQWLRSLDDGSHSASDIARTMGLTKDSVHKRLKKLRADKHETTPPRKEAGLSVPDAGDGFVGIRTIWWDLAKAAQYVYMHKPLVAVA